MRVVIITQARMTSTRLPGKVLRKVQWKSLLEHQLDRLKRVASIVEVIVATTVNHSDEPIVELCKKLQVAYHRGSENDVLARYYGAAEPFKPDVVVRVTSDCPVIDPGVIEQVIQFYIDHYPNYDYVSNCLTRSYPRGMDTEVFSFQALEEAFNEATALPDREHVTPFIQNQPDRYRLGDVSYHQNQNSHRWTVDTEEDFDLISKIIDTLYPEKANFNLEDILKILEQNPEWKKINTHVEQKKYGE